MLHNDKETFEQVILKVASETGIEPSIIEKDYYVTLFLKKIVQLQPNIIFKGGTSLSKCYKVINRFVGITDDCILETKILIKKLDKCFSEDELLDIYNRLLPYADNSNERKSEHIEYVKKIQKN